MIYHGTYPEQKIWKYIYIYIYGKHLKSFCHYFYIQIVSPKKETRGKKNERIVKFLQM